MIGTADVNKPFTVVVACIYAVDSHHMVQLIVVLPNTCVQIVHLYHWIAARYLSVNSGELQVEFVIFCIGGLLNGGIALYIETFLTLLWKRVQILVLKIFNCSRPF